MLRLPALMAAVALPRLLLLPFNENLFGDAIPRTEMGERWMAHPHLMTAFGDGAGQYGPLHLYLVGLATAFADREIAGRLVALLCGVLTVIPLYQLGRRLFGARSGHVACLALAAWGLHIQFSTTAASESLAILLMMAALASFASARESGRTRDLVWAATWLNLAEAVRYDAWMYPPVLVAAVVVTRSSSALSTRQLAGFVTSCLLFPLSWMLGNYQMHGDPTFPVDYINEDHRRWAATFEGAWRQLWLRVQGIAFWPVIAPVTLTPGVALLGILGAMTTWRERPAVRWLLIVAFAPVLYYAIRTTVFADFVPLTRYIAVPLTVLLVFVWDGYLSIAGAWGTTRARRVARFAVALAIGVPLAIGWFTFRRDGRLEDILRSISPTSTNPRAVMAGAEFIRSTVRPAGHGFVVDVDERFLDLPLVFYGRAPEEGTIRVRETGDLSRLGQDHPRFVFRFDHGRLLAQTNVSLIGRTLELGGAFYDELDGFSPPLHVYALRNGGGRPTP